jgi:UDP-N-acetylmuramate--alanine ligase
MRRFPRRTASSLPLGIAGRDDLRMSDWQGRELHFIAVGGAGMSALALIADRLGATVTGSDRAESSYLERLRRAGLQPRVGHDPDAVPAGAEVVVSTAIREDNSELARARERGQRVLHRGELLAEVCELRRLIAVAGTHGKTTTAGMLAHAMLELGADPSFLLGGELPGPAAGEAANAAWGEGEWVIAEADESDASFLHLRPEVAVVTNVELDHHSHWASRAELFEAFRRFAEPARGVALGPDPALDALAEGEEALRFDETTPGPPVELNVPGRHNLLNARAALAALQLAGFELDRAGAALASFPGMLRRLELKGRRDGALIYDDYAHHPTEVSAALEALRELGPGRLIAVFQPHLYSRTKALAPAFGAALAAADQVGVLDVYPAREEPVGELEGVSGLDVARAVAERGGGRPVWWLKDAESAERALAPQLRDGDLLVTIGAGDIHRLADALVGASDEVAVDAEVPAGSGRRPDPPTPDAKRRMSAE